MTIEDSLSEQPFYNAPISKRKSNKLTNQELLQVLPFYDSVGITKKDTAFRNYVSTYSVEIMDRESLLDTLHLSRTSINELLTDFLRERRGFKYFLTDRVTLKKFQGNNFIINRPYFNSKTKTVINDRYFIKDSFEELTNRLNQWTNEASGWIINKVEDFYINIANYEPLSGSSYILLPKELNNSMTGLINIKDKDLKYFMRCHIKLINPTDSDPERINKQDKKISSTLDYSGIDFPMKTHDYQLVEERFEMNVAVFCYENKIYPLYISKNSNTQVLNVLLITSKEKSHYVFIKDFDRLMYSKAKTKNQHKNFLCMACLQNFTTEEILSNHRKQYLLINGCQAVNYESGIIKVKNSEKQVPIPFKIYADTECFLKRTNSYKVEHITKNQEHFPNSIGAKLVCIGDRFNLPVIIFKGEKFVNKFIKWIFRQQKQIKRVIKEHFNKELIMTTQDEEVYNNSQICWIVMKS